MHQADGSRGSVCDVMVYCLDNAEAGVEAMARRRLRIRISGLLQPKDSCDLPTAATTCCENAGRNGSNRDLPDDWAVHCEESTLSEHEVWRRSSARHLSADKRIVFQSRKPTMEIPADARLPTAMLGVEVVSAFPTHFSVPQRSLTFNRAVRRLCSPWDNVLAEYCLNTQVRLSSSSAEMKSAQLSLQM
eukprot:s2599_g12.t1